MNKLKLISLLFLFLPFIINIIFFSFPITLKQQFILKQENISFVNLFACNFIHLNLNHFLNNMLVYFIVVFLIFILFLKSNKEKLFIKIMLFSLIVLPFLLSLIDLLFYWLINGPSSHLGFSGINGFYIGLLPFSLVIFIKNKSVFYLFFYLGLFEILIIFRWWLLLIFFILLFKPPNLFIHNYVIIWFVLSIYMLGIFWLFPFKIIYSNAIIDIFIHFIGLMFGWVVYLKYNKKIKKSYF